MDAAEAVGRSWSSSNIGFHADVYYEGLQSPPPGAHFSPEWGFLGKFQGTTGNWKEYPRDVVVQHIDAKAGNPDISHLQQDADDATRIFLDSRDDVMSLLRAHLRFDDDEHKGAILDEVASLQVLSYDEALRARFRRPPITRDTSALSQGSRSAPHQEVIARVISIGTPFEAAGRLSALSRRAARHLERVGGQAAPTPGQPGLRSRIVIGHGHSRLWHELKDFISDRLGLDWDEFNRIAAAGVATTDRLRQMLDSAAIAFLVATAEDETAEGTMVARQNVVHEIGLFQGHLGFGRAIVLLEESCEGFSNIHGLGQIRFPRGRISACFEEVRRVLEREGVL